MPSTHPCPGPAPPPCRAQGADPATIDKITRHIARLHGQLRRWLLHDPALAARVGGRLFPEHLAASTGDDEGFDFDYYDGRIRLGERLLLRWSRLLGAIGPKRWEEVVRLFLLHEGHHIGQGMGYNSRNVGRAGFALEAVDYDADVAAVEICLRWHGQKGAPPQGEMRALGGILDNLLVGLSLFDGRPEGGPLLRVKERRLRRHLIWHFQRARAHAAPKNLPVSHLRLEDRVVLEFPGLVTTIERKGRHQVRFVHLDRLCRARDPEVVIYAAGRLYRCPDATFCHDLLAALRQTAAEGVSQVFHRLFEQHPGLVPV